MTQTAHLEELARQVRNATRDVLAAAKESWLTWAPPGTSNHILWHAGHALWLQVALCILPLTGRSELPSGWREAFGSRCRPVNTTSHWPVWNEVHRLLTEQLGRFVRPN
jgi:hypothetical protein